MRGRTMSPADVRFRSMRWKLLFLVTALAFLVAAVSAGYSLVSGGYLLREQMEKRGQYMIGNLAYNCRSGVLTEDKPQLLALLDGAITVSGGSGSDVVAAAIWNAHGEVLARAGRPMPGRDPSPTTAAASTTETSTEDGEDVLVFQAPVLVSGAGEAAEMGLAAGAGVARVGGQVEVAISKRALAARQRRTLLNTFGVGGLVLVLGSLGGFYVTGRWVRPVRHMVRVSTEVAGGNLTHGVSVASRDEMGVLAASLNEMVANLRRLAVNIQGASSHVATAATRISAGAAGVADGARRQARATDETSASMAEITASIQ